MSPGFCGVDQGRGLSRRPLPWIPSPLGKGTSVILEISQELVHTAGAGQWRYQIEGMSGHVVPVYLLDCKMDSNTPQDRALTDYLYGGDDRYRLCPETILV
jgi:starch phosphorylase